LRRYPNTAQANEITQPAGAADINPAKGTMMTTSQRFTASTLLATAAVGVGVGLAWSAPASADTGLFNNRTEHSVTSPKPDVAKIVKVVKQIAQSLHAKPCRPAPAPEAAD
jgi:hypothetical protein